MIRIATTSDASNLAALSIQVWLHTYAKSGLRNALSDYVLAEFTPEKIAASVNDENQVFVVYEENAHLLGYLRLILNSPIPSDPESRVEIAKLYVQEHFVGRGIGSALLKYALAYCDKLGITSVWLAVNHENTNALRFYEQHAFLRNGSTFFHLENEQHENFILSKLIALSASDSSLETREH
ncbi:GNAT family N-acetyltransferase [Microvirga alba]|uniref:GNAT family N-acetyltransferase n=1 Tax=Microvirga alba TaxID=2791025 RepID=A0A931BK52_9HYPH|nr:GNAT family N-acetyltransferase [Microvirga alba]MBF9232421.1 GNAT family N-acetyltransferase [Microvirga alba]